MRVPRCGFASPALLLGVALAVLAGPSLRPARAAETARHAVLVGHGDGGPDLGALRYTGRDVAKMRQVLLDLGGYKPDTVDTLQDVDSGEVIRRLRRAEERVRADKAAGRTTMLLVYYSGHAKAGSLRLGKTRLDLSLLRSLLEESQADVRLAIIDACGAGEMTRDKGGARAPPLVVALDDTLTARGQVIIASSAETEASQESDDIQGSFFTHYWVSGLRGDADRSGDGKVTLDEAYTYAYARTVAATAHTRGGVQHPSYRYQLRGAGEVVVAHLDSTTSAVRFPEDLSGRFMVFDLERQVVVAEVDKTRGRPLRLAVKGGTYAIKKRENDHLLMQKVRLSSQQEAVVDPANMQKVSFDDDYAKGDIIRLEEVVGRRQGMFGLSLSTGLGAQGFVNVPWQTPTFPATSIATFQVRYHGLFNRHVLLGGDLNLGGRDYQAVINGGALGELRYRARFFLVEAGVALMWEQELWRMRFAAGPRLGTIYLYRLFLEDVPGDQDQNYFNFAPGVAAYAGLDLFRFLHLELGARANYLIYYLVGETPKNIGYASVTLAMHADL